MNTPKISPQILAKVALISGKRSRIVVEHIVVHGSITTEDLENYGYKHPPRAFRDVREQGLPLETFWTKNSLGRRIAGYRFGDESAIRNDRLSGRQVLSKIFQTEVCILHNSKCGVCQTRYEPRYLQTDHRIPFEVVGESENRDAKEYMPLCAACNRAKSWSCEHCENWSKMRDPSICSNCCWAYPEAYSHIAMKPMRRLELVWEGKEIGDYEAVLAAAKAANELVPSFVKHVLRDALQRGDVQ